VDAGRVVGGLASVRAPLDRGEVGQLERLLQQADVWPGRCGSCASLNRRPSDQRRAELRLDPRVLAGTRHVVGGRAVGPSPLHAWSSEVPELVVHERLLADRIILPSVLTAGAGLAFFPSS